MKHILCRSVDDPAILPLLKGISTVEGRYAYLKRTFADPIGRILKAYEYKHFLKTLYWRIIRDYLLSTREQICDCGSKHLLDIHHKSYGHHGWEHLYLDDLIFMCMECHKKRHNITNIEIKRLLKDLAFRKRGPSLSSSKANPGYDPRGVTQEIINAEK